MSFLSQPSGMSPQEILDWLIDLRENARTFGVVQTFPFRNAPTRAVSVLTVNGYGVHSIKQTGSEAPLSRASQGTIQAVALQNLDRTIELQRNRVGNIPPPPPPPTLEIIRVKITKAGGIVSIVNIPASQLEQTKLGQGVVSVEVIASDGSEDVEETPINIDEIDPETGQGGTFTRAPDGSKIYRISGQSINGGDILRVEIKERLSINAT